MNFSVVHRNPGHWDIVNQKIGRLFRIRGGPGNYWVSDERQKPYPIRQFKTVNACIGAICDELMFELVVAEGQEPHVIENWNLST